MGQKSMFGRQGGVNHLFNRAQAKCSAQESDRLAPAGQLRVDPPKADVARSNSGGDGGESVRRVLANPSIAASAPVLGKLSERPTAFDCDHELVLHSE
jgi:hypothetical protein